MIPACGPYVDEGCRAVASTAVGTVPLARPGSAWLTPGVQPLPEGLDDEVGGLAGVRGGQKGTGGTGGKERRIAARQTEAIAYRTSQPVAQPRELMARELEDGEQIVR